MRKSHLLRLSVLGVGLLTAVGLSSAWAADSPADRKPTDAGAISSPASTVARPVPIEDLFYSRRVSSPAWSPDGRRIAFTTNLTGRANLWVVNSDGGWPLQLAVSDDRQNGAVWSPDGKWIVYQQDFGGSEYYDLFAVPSSGGAPVNLTNSPDISETTALFSPDGKTIALDYKPKASPTSDIALMDWNSRSGAKAHQRDYERPQLDGRSLESGWPLDTSRPQKCSVHGFQRVLDRRCLR